MGLGLTKTTRVCIHCRVTDAASIIVYIWIDQSIILELQCPVLKFPKAVDQHTEDVNSYRIFGRFKYKSKQSFYSTQLALSISSSGHRLFLIKTTLTQSIFERSITVLMEAYVAIRTVQQRIILLVVWTETSSTCSFEYAFVIFTRLLALLATDIILKSLHICDRFLFIN